MKGGYSSGWLIIMFLISISIVTQVAINMGIEKGSGNIPLLLGIPILVVFFINKMKVDSNVKRLEKLKSEVFDVTLNSYKKLKGSTNGFDMFFEHLDDYPIKIEQGYEREWVYDTISWAILNIFIEEFKNDHLVQLKRDYKRLRTIDEYGISNTSKWDKKLREIITSIIISKYYTELQNVFDTFGGIRGLSVDYSQKDVHVESMVKLLSLSIESEEKIESLYKDSLSYQIKITPEMSGLEYELAIAELVNTSAVDWSATVTQGSGDQGLDVMIKSLLCDFQIAVQCKLYNSPVGNKAVQEVNAAHSFYNTDLSCVVTNNSFTKSANELALTTNVMLLHHDSILDWLEEIRERLN